MSLTPKREAFALAFVETSNGSESYRRAFKADNMSAPAIAVEASRLLDDPNVALRVKELQALHVERHKLTVDDILAELEEARSAASAGERPQAAAMVAASLGKAKLLGMLTDKVDHTSSDGSMAPTRIVIEAAPLRKKD